MSPATGFYVKVSCVLVVLLAFGGLLYGSYLHGESVANARWQLQWADQQPLQAKWLAAATTANRNEEQRRQAAVNQVGSDAREQVVIASADGVAADAAGERVREQAGRLVTNASCTANDSGSASRGASTTRAAMVLSDLFQRADKRAGELAKAYDQARIAGFACEAAYASLHSMN